MSDDVMNDDERATRQRIVMDRIITGSQLDRQTFPDLEWIVPGIIPEGYGLLVGPPKVGKSWLTLGIGLSVALGGKALGSINVQPRPVLLLALEDGFRRLQDRSRSLLAHEPIPDSLHMYVEPGPDVLNYVLPGWLEQHGHERPLVILDTLGTVQPPKLAGESEYQRDYRTGQMLKGFIHDYPGSGLLVVHHTRKMGSDDWMDSTSGTNGVNGSADFTVSLAADRQSTTGVLSVTGRDVQAGSYAVTFDGGAWRLDGDGLAAAADAARAIRAKQGRSDTQGLIVDALNGSPDPMRPKEISERTGLDERKVNTYLGRLVEAGTVDKLGRGLYMLPPSEGVGSVGLLFSGQAAKQQNNTTNTPTGVGNEDAA